MNKQPFRFDYIDAFAGSGYREEIGKESKEQTSLFSQDDIREIETYSKGSARLALQIVPEFSEYIFIEKSKNHFNELKKLISEFPRKVRKIEIHNMEANKYISQLCNGSSWKKHRAVMFLDPYGMQVNWKSIELIAKTKAIDLWYLFPLGIGVNRLLKKQRGSIPESWSKKLDSMLGTKEWQKNFYSAVENNTLFGNEEKIIKDTSFSKISKFIIKRLKLIFPGVAENPLLLHNSKNNPLYLLCFVSGNEKGSKTAIKIAQDILKG